MAIYYSNYEVLGVSAQADYAEIKKQYRRLVRQYSPEHQPEKFKLIREAYENLTGDFNIRKNEQYPIYKAPYTLAKETKETKEVTINRGLLSDCFETIYNTEFELNKLMEK